MAEPRPDASGTNIVVDEPIVSLAPLIVQRVVKFGETDAAGVVYTGRFLDYALEAFDSWFRCVMGLTWPQQAARKVGTPAVSCHLEFARPLRAGDPLAVEVLIDRIGGGSFTIRTVGRNRDGREVFEATLVFATIDTDDRTPIRIPDDYRRRMTDYVAACAAVAPAPTEGA